MTEEGVRHVFLAVGPTTVLHPFEILAGPALPAAPGAMFERGRLDHFALSAPSKETFLEIRRRLESEAVADGDVRDMRTMYALVERRETVDVLGQERDVVHALDEPHNPLFYTIQMSSSPTPDTTLLRRNLCGSWPSTIPIGSTLR